MTSKNRVTFVNISYWGKDKELSKEIFEENGNKFVLKVWFKIGAKGICQRAIMAFIDRTDKVISIFQL